VTSPLPLIAVVDDEALVRSMLRRLLRLADYDVTAFESGEEFLASLAARCPACAILDIHMPGFSGLEVQSRLCVAHPALPVIFVTASDDARLEQAVMEAGATRLLRKPFTNAALIEAVDAALNRRD
jgi:FixJ family two-component response regulator